MQKQELEFVSEITPISPWKAFVGFAADFFISFGVMMFAIFFVAPSLQKAFGYDDVARDMTSLAAESHLFYTKSDTTFEISPYLYGLDYEKKIDEHGKIKDAYGEVDASYVGKYPFELYEDLVYDYFLDFVGNGKGSLISYSGKLLTEYAGKSKEEIGRYIGENYFKITDSEDSYYRFAKDENGIILYASKPVHNEANATIQGLSDAKKELSSAAALNAFFVTSNSTTFGVYETCISNYVSYEPHHREYYSAAERIVFLAKIPTRLVPPLIFILILPLILHDGKSIGRLLSGSAVIDKGGYCAKKWRILIHQGILFLPWLLALLPYDVLALFSVAILYMIDFLVYNVSPSKRSIHELAAGTLTVNDYESDYFKSKEEMEEYAKNLAKGAPKRKKEKKKKEDATSTADAFVLADRNAVTELPEPSVSEEASISKEEEVEVVEPKEEIKEAPAKEPDEDDFLDERK